MQKGHRVAAVSYALYWVPASSCYSLCNAK